MGSPRISDALAARLYHQANAERWDLPRDAWAEALEASASRAGAPSAAELQRYLGTLHLEDLALACACASGSEAAWEYFIREQRPVLRRAAAAIDPGGDARDLADSLYADLYGVRERRGDRRSLFSYFHGRSSLATWLRAVMAQRHVDRLRERRRFEPLPEEGSAARAAWSEVRPQDPERLRYLALVGQALVRALSRLDPRDRLRIGCYYGQGLTLAEIGRLVGEHEASTSRHLARARRAIRDDVERDLRVDGHLSEAEIADCFACVEDDPGPIDLSAALKSSEEAARNSVSNVPDGGSDLSSGGRPLRGDDREE